jgi:hypothetical protein
VTQPLWSAAGFTPLSFFLRPLHRVVLGGVNHANQEKKESGVKPAALQSIDAVASS